MTKRVLPLLRVQLVVRKLVHDELVDVAEGQHFVARGLNGHGGERNVGIGRLFIAVRGLARSRHLYLDLRLY